MLRKIKNRVIITVKKMTKWKDCEIKTSMFDYKKCGFGTHVRIAKNCEIWGGGLAITPMSGIIQLLIMQLSESIVR